MTISSLEIQALIHQGWITPQEQLERLALSQFEKELGIDHEILPEKSVKSATHSILKQSGISLAGSEGPPSLFNLCVESLVPSQLPSNLTNWYTALERIGALPDTIPPLPENIHEILNGTCPIYGEQFTVGETHSLYLIPPGTLNELGTRVSAYGERFFQGENHPLKFRLSWTTPRAEHANTPNSQPQWVLISNKLLPGSRKQLYAKQVQMVEDLSRKSSVDYQVPTLWEAIGAVFLHKVATNESLYEGGNRQNGYLPTLTYVKETTEDWHLIVGDLTLYGLDVRCSYDKAHENIGVAAVRKLSNQSVSI